MGATTARRAGLLTGLCGVALAGSAIIAAPASAVDPLLPEDNTHGCQGTAETPSSGDHSLSLVSWEGGVATFSLEFPADAESTDDFVVIDCLMGPDGKAIAKYEIPGINNGVPYVFSIAVPDEPGEYCDQAKTVADPSAPLAGNRKTNSVCVTVDEPTEEPSEEPSEEVSEQPSEEPSEQVSEQPSEEPSEEPSVEPSETVEPGATPTISPTVLGVKIVRPTKPTLPQTGTPTSLLVSLGIALAVAGSGLVFSAGRYQRQH